MCCSSHSLCFSVMALAAAFLCEDQFTCSICLEVFENPVSTPCGHSFCQRCISSYWDGGRGGNRVYLCPICKESFRKRPELHINRTLKEITEQFKHIASAGIPVEGGDVGGAGRGFGKDSAPQPHPTLPQRSRDMPESIIAEMMTRFQRMPGGVHPAGPLQSVQHGPLVTDSKHGDLPPLYHTPPPRRYTLLSFFTGGVFIVSLHLLTGGRCGQVHSERAERLFPSAAFVPHPPERPGVLLSH